MARIAEKYCSRMIVGDVESMELSQLGTYDAIILGDVVEHLRDPVDGTTYVARVCGRPRTGGTWEGWLEFVAVGAAVVLRTERETTQSNRQGVAYWASGLEPSYLEGAFARARRETLAAVSV